jgi:hypothetical protein
MNSLKCAYVPVCDCADHENVHIFFQYRQIQAQIMKMCIYLTQYRQIQAGSDHEKVHIFAQYKQIQANMNSKPVHICLFVHVCHMQKPDIQAHMNC